MKNLFSFDASRETPEMLAERRARAAALAGQIGGATTIGGGIGDIFRGLGAGLSRYRADSAQREGEASGRSAMDGFLDLLDQPAAPPMTAPSNDAVRDSLKAGISTGKVPPLATYTPPGPQNAGQPNARPTPAYAPPMAEDTTMPEEQAPEAAPAPVAAPANPDRARMAQMVAILRNPWVPEADKAMVRQRYEDLLKKSDPEYIYEQQMKRTKDALEVGKAKIELHNLQNPDRPMQAWTDPNNGDLYAYEPHDPAGTKVLVQKAGSKNARATPPTGYRYKTDGSGQLEAIPGGPAAPDSDVAKDIAKGIVDGTQPPNTQGLYRYGAQVRAELSKQGFDLSKAQLEFNATNRALSTMNGPQQTRMRQNIGTLSESLPLVRDLAKQWKAGKYPLLNKATLVAATQGTLGPDAQSLANRLQAQIADVTAELGSVYMGGNSPTDHAFDLAAKSLSADWSESTLLDMVKLAETNVRYRQNALNQPVAGIADNPYDPRGAVPTISPAMPAAVGGDGQGAEPPAAGGLPDGWSQEEFDVLTPEEQKELMGQ